MRRQEASAHRLPSPASRASLSIMDQPGNGQAPGSFPGADVIIEHLANLATQISGPYQARRYISHATCERLPRGAG